jgi:predicted flap endonuclease-1-like 5' DNA nuclease
MSWLITQIWLLLLLSFALGALFGWLLRGWHVHKVAVALLDARARHAADATEQARQRSEANELRDRQKKLESDLQAAKAGNGAADQLRGQIGTLESQLAQAVARSDELAADKAALGATAAALEGRAHALAAELELLRERLRHDDLALASTRHELAQAQERLRHPPTMVADPAQLLLPASTEALPLAAALAPDDLQQIVGVGPKLNALLHSLGIRHYAQIAHWTDADIDQAAAQLPGFGGRIRRDDWRGQCRVLHRLKYGSEV